MAGSSKMETETRVCSICSRRLEQRKGTEFKHRYPFLYVIIEHLRKHRGEVGKYPTRINISEKHWDGAYDEMKDWCAENHWGIPLVKEAIDDLHFLLKGVPIIRGSLK